MKRGMKRGFTLVEILIVVTVIGIIAGVGVVSYSGHTQRARNTARLDAANSYVNILDTMIAKNPAILQSSTDANFCLGTWFSGGYCYLLEAGANRYLINNTKNSDMQAVAASLPNSPPEPVLGADGKQYIGPFAKYIAPTGGDQWGKMYVYYVLERSAASTCPSGVQDDSGVPNSDDAKVIVCKMKVQTDFTNSTN